MVGPATRHGIELVIIAVIMCCPQIASAYRGRKLTHMLKKSDRIPATVKMDVDNSSAVKIGLEPIWTPTSLLEENKAVTIQEVAPPASSEEPGPASMDGQQGKLPASWRSITSDAGHQQHRALAVAFVVSVIATVFLALIFAGMVSLLRAMALRKSTTWREVQEAELYGASLQAIVSARREVLRNMIEMAIANAESMEKKQKVSCALFNEFMERLLTCTKQGFAEAEALRLLEVALDRQDQLENLKDLPEELLRARAELIEELLNSFVAKVSEGHSQIGFLTELISGCAMVVKRLVKQGAVQNEALDHLLSAMKTDGQLALRMQVLVNMPPPTCCKPDSCCAPIAEVMMG